MPRRTPVLPVVYTDIALAELDEIAAWNEKTYNREHARRYIAFLEQHIDRPNRSNVDLAPIFRPPLLVYGFLELCQNFILVLSWSTRRK